MTTDPVARELALQIEAQQDLYFYTRYLFKERRGYRWMQNWHHLEVCDALMKVYRGETKRLIINIPPRYSKTEIAVINFMAWCLGKKPDCEFIHISYSAMLAANNAFQTRNMVQEEAYQRVFPELKLRDDSKAKDNWRTTAGGVVYATGTGGTITGFGAGKMREGFGGCIIIDDPHKADEASSKTVREGVIDWFQNTLESRTNSPETPIIVIMQRLHEEDLSGWLLGNREDGVPKAGGNGEVWEHLCLSAIQEDGSALWPAKHNIQRLTLMEKAAPYVFAGQYRQRPAPPAGGFFKPDNIEIVDALPADILNTVRAWDLGATEGEGDYTAGVKEAKSKDGYTYIIDIQRAQLGPDNVNKRLKQTAQLDGKTVKICLPQDPGQAGKSQVAAFGKLLAGYTVEAHSISGDKITRAQPFAAQVNLGNVRMLRGDWNKDFIDELRNFPNGKHDDQVDAASDAYNDLNGGFETFFTNMGLSQ
ncbi:MAG: phage terminase large subunit [Acinetobacter sp.]